MELVWGTAIAIINLVSKQMAKRTYLLRRCVTVDGPRKFIWVLRKRSQTRRGCKYRPGFRGGSLRCWQISHEATYFVTDFKLPGKYSRSLILAYVRAIPTWPLGMESRASVRTFSQTFWVPLKVNAPFRPKNFYDTRHRFLWCKKVCVSYDLDNPQILARSK